MLRRLIATTFACATVLGSAGPSPAQVSVNIGINLPAPPPLVVVPSSPVQYAPSVEANYFFYGGEYFVFDGAHWYASSAYNGPWVVLAPEFIPMPVLQVPVRFYRRPPPEWRAWRHEAPPQWAPAWGRRWQERRHEGQAQPRFEPRQSRPEPRFEPRQERREERRDERREDRRDERREDRRGERGGERGGEGRR